MRAARWPRGRGRNSSGLDFSTILYDSMNALTFQALRMLADGEFRSGEAMARVLGVSRASVWNALHALDASGIEIFRVRGRGYRLAEPLSLLANDAIESALGAAAPRFSIEVIDRVESTNTLLMQRAAAGARSGTVIAAEWQTDGRGRRGRAWHALPGAALTFSLLWRFEQGAGLLAGLSLAVGVAVTRALAQCGVRDAGLEMAERRVVARAQARRYPHRNAGRHVGTEHGRDRHRPQLPHAGGIARAHRPAGGRYRDRRGRCAGAQPPAGEFADRTGSRADWILRATDSRRFAMTGNAATFIRAGRSGLRCPTAASSTARPRAWRKMARCCSPRNPDSCACTAAK